MCPAALFTALQPPATSHQPPASPGDTHLTSHREQTFLPHQWGFGRQIEIFGRFLTFLSILYLNFKKSYSSVPSVSVHIIPLHLPVWLMIWPISSCCVLNVTVDSKENIICVVVTSDKMCAVPVCRQKCAGMQLWEQRFSGDSATKLGYLRSASMRI